MAYTKKFSKTEMKLLWNTVKEIIRNNHSMIITKSESLRDSQYVVRDILTQQYLPEGKISLDLITFFMTESNAYTYFTQDIWTQLEREGYERPTAKPIGIMYWEDNSWTVDKIEYNSLLRQASTYSLP